ncbi:hypothetical protein C8J56DRAFT_909215 [Mycena floridula]|nr:hypothetical protein C8J56DRAFT_909215 [Mycena floridula]
MPSVLDAFKLKSLDLEPIFAKWKENDQSPAVFTGNSKTGPALDEWLAKIKQVCEREKIPVQYWHRVAQHYMGAEAQRRLDEIKRVMTTVHGGKYRWTWTNFKIAMRNMGWNLNVAATETIQVHAKKGTGHWWFSRQKEEDFVMVESSPPMPPTTKRRATFDLTRTASKLKRAASEDWLGKREKEEGSGKMTQSVQVQPPPPLTKSPSFLQNMWPTERPSLPQKSKSDSVIEARPSTSEAVTVGAQAPIWLVNACTALDFLHTEHPKVMSTLAAILITVGTLPAVPAVAAGAGGALLASGAAHAVGAIAVGLGTWIQTQQGMSQHGGSASRIA